MKSLLSVLLLSSFCLQGFTHGQAVTTSPSENGEGPLVRMLLLTQESPSVEVYYFSDGMEAPEGPLLIGSLGLSKPFNAPSNNFLLVIKDAQQANGYRPVARVILDESGSKVTLLLLPEGNKMKAFAINADNQAFDNKTVLFFNAAETPLAARLGSKVTVIHPKTPTKVPVPEQSEKPWYQVSLFEPTADGHAKFFSNTRWPYQSSTRTYIFMYRNQYNDRISYKAVDEPVVFR